MHANVLPVEILATIFLISTILVESGTVHKRQASGQKNGMCDCRDWYGQCRKEGEMWVDDETWKYACNDGKTKISACMASSRANGQAIPLNMNVTVGEFWYACVADMTEGKEFVKYAQEPSCEKNGKTLRNGDKFRDEYFVWQCEEWGIDIVGCHFEDVELGPVELPLHKSRVIGCFEHKCKKLTEFPWRIRYVAQPIKGCVGTNDQREAAIRSAVQRGEDRAKLITNEIGEEKLPLPKFADAFFQFDGSYNEKVRYENVKIIY